MLREVMVHAIVGEASRPVEDLPKPNCFVVKEVVRRPMCWIVVAGSSGKEGLPAVVAHEKWTS